MPTYRTTRRLAEPGAHIPALDGLRGVAILMVLAIHFTVMRPSAPPDFVVYSLARTGWMGVDLFFVLSGFLITGILHDTRGREGALRSFYLRRLLRIFPLYYGFLLALFGLAPLLAAGGWMEDARAHQAWHWVYLSNVLAALEGWAAAPHLGHLWSLAIEEQFYLLWPLVALALPAGPLARVCGGLLALSLVARVALLAADASPIALYTLTFTRWDGLAIGALIALASRRPEWSARLVRASAPALVVGTMALAPMVWAHPYRSHYGEVMQVVGYPLVGMVFGALLVRVLAAPAGAPLQRVLCVPALCMLGRYSYGVYLLHVPLLGWLLHAKLIPAPLPVLWGSALPAQLAVWVGATAVTLAVAVPIWHVWERPFLSLKHRVPQPVSREASPVPGLGRRAA